MKKRKTSLADKIFVVLNTLFMIAFVVITLYPVLNTLAISLNDGIDAVRGGIYLWPRKFTLNNYKTVLTKQNMLQGAYNRIKNYNRNTAFPGNQCAFGICGQQKAFYVQVPVISVLGNYHVCKRRYDSNLYVIQKPAPDRNLLGICYSRNNQCI